MKCPKCGRENVSGAPFCADCGKALYAHDVTPDTQVPADPKPVDEQASDVVVEIATPLETAVAVEAIAPASASAETFTPSVISDGTIHIAPMASEVDAQPIPDPEPAAKFQEAFVSASPAEVREEVVSDMADEASATEVSEAETSIGEEVADEAPAPGAAVSASAFSAMAVSEEMADGPAVVAETAAETTVSEPSEAVKAVGSAEPVVSEPAAQMGAQAQETATASQSQPAPEQAAYVSANGTPIVPPNPARAHQDYPQQGNEALYKKGCLGAAWDDVVQSKGWFGKMCLLGLVEFVPVLNFYVPGYAMRWSRELFLGKVGPMPEHIFGNRMFVNGCFDFLFALIVGLITAVCSVILGFIPVLGGICIAVLSLFLFIFSCVAILRIAIADRFGAGFDVTQIWNACKKNFGALCCATLIPYLIATVIIFVVLMAVTMIVGIPLMGIIFSTAAYSYGASSMYYASALLESLVALLPVFLILGYALNVVNAFMSVLIYRAVGHYVTRYAQEWKNEAAVMSTAYINDQPPRA